ncbi:MAG: acid phosphatase type 7 [Solirubrobacteraceae bacterium]|jgi:alkaline phosphatase|nr:acid phosphatase type 7 [Solirubrobacteraceae bacterium]
MRSVTIAAVCISLFAAAGCGSGSSATPATVTPPAAASGVRGPTLVAAGDIACPPGEAPTSTSCRQGQTAALIGRLTPAVVATLGDLQYPGGELDNFRASYGPSWGRFRARTRPAPGNHEWVTPGGAGYFSYFGTRAGPRGRGWYSYDVGTWHVVVLNSNCADVGCASGSAQERWLRADLARHRGACTLAYWHHPRFSSGLHGNTDAVAPLWRTLERAGADLVLSGHDHSYERFRAQTSTGRASTNGMVEFVVGTGGVSNYPIIGARPNSLVRRSFVFGVLELTLGRGAYAWRFVSVPGITFRDSGTGRCR